VFPCTEQGILHAIAAAAGPYVGPYTFACDKPTTVTTTNTIVIPNDVILDGEMRLTVHGNESHGVFMAPDAEVTVELKQMTIAGGSRSDGGSGIHSRGPLKMSDCTVSGNSGTYSSAIAAFETLTLTDTTVSDNACNGIGNSGVATLNRCTISGNERGAISNSGALTLNESTVTDNEARHGGAISSSGALVVNDSTISRNNAPSGAGISSDIEEGGSVTLNRSTVSDNTATECGAIHVWGTLTIRESVISGNRAGGAGGICSQGTLLVILSTVSGNTATWPSSYGGGINSSGQATLIDSTISQNSASDGGGVSADGELTVRSSTMSGNLAERGGGIRIERGTLTVENSTLSENIALEAGGAIQSRQNFNLVSSTLTGNSSDTGSAISFASSSNAVMRNSILDGDCDLEFGYMPASDGGNIESPGDTCGLTAPSDQPSLSAMQVDLGSLQDNGGPTLTHLPGSGSAAVDAVDLADCVGADGVRLTADQRGVERPQGATCDVGAVEIERAP
jgi:hypothetical protein